MKILVIALTIVSLQTFAGGGDYTNKYQKPEANTELSVRPAAPTLTAPKALSKLATTETELKWDAVTTAEGYHVQVSADPGFFNLHLDQYLKETTAKVSGLEKGKIYYWRVAATKASNLKGFTIGGFTRSSFETN